MSIPAGMRECGTRHRLFVIGITLGCLCAGSPMALLVASQAAKKPPTQGTSKAPVGAAQSARVQAPPKPSLDVLNSRVTTFWGLLARGQKKQALQYVEPSRRKIFETWQPPQFTNPRITTLSLSPKAEEVTVTVEVRCVMPPMSAPITWPVTEDWVFHSGNWYVVIEQPTLSAIFPTTQAQLNAMPPTPQEMELRQKAIRQALQFETTTLDFGSVRRGENIPLSLGYSLAGNEPYGIVFRNIPDEFNVLDPSDRKLAAGKERKIRFDFLTQAYAGDVNEKFTAVVSNQGVEVPFEFTLHGYVYVPVYGVPMTLRFKAGEREKEVVVKNDSKSVVTLRTADNKEFDVTPLPQTLPPGGKCIFKVRIVKDRSEKNRIDAISLSFDQPVENLEGLDLSIIRNYEAEAMDPEKAEEMRLRELLKKAGVPVKK